MTQSKDNLDEYPSGILARLALVPRKVRQKGIYWLSLKIVQELNGIVRGGIKAIAKARQNLLYCLITLEPGVRRLSQRTLFVYYDLNEYPISYDICWFLVWADINRRRQGKSNLHCIYVPIEDEAKRRYPGNYAEIVDRNSRAWRFNNICVASSALISHGAGVTVCESSLHADVMQLVTRNHVPRRTILKTPPTLAIIYRETTAALAADRESWEGLSETVQGRRYVDMWLRENVYPKKPIVITVRRYGVEPERNSSMCEWAAFAKNLQSEIYQPIFVLDTDTSFIPIPELSGLLVFHAAAWNVGLRMALYEAAYLNMFVNSGAGSLCILNRACRYLFFKVSVASTHLASEETLMRMGFKSGMTPPFATPLQKWVWEDDNCDVLKREFADMVKKIEQATGHHRHINEIQLKS